MFKKRSTTPWQSYTLDYNAKISSIHCTHFYKDSTNCINIWFIDVREQGVWFHAESIVSLICTWNTKKYIERYVRDMDCMMWCRLTDRYITLPWRSHALFVNQRGLLVLLEQLSTLRAKRIKHFVHWLTHIILPSIDKQDHLKESCIMNFFDSNEKLLTPYTNFKDYHHSQWCKRFSYYY